jgi:alpha-beta hydrolase superfamily lysophospholipase
MQRAGESWGTRAQIGATLKELLDLEGNRDGLWDNEDQPAGRYGHLLARASVGLRLSVFGAGVSERECMERLLGYRSRVEKRWGQPAVSAEARSRLRRADLFSVQKAISLERWGRTPESVVEHFVDAAGALAGHAVAPRRIFTQHFKPTAPPSRGMIVVVPGYLETGRTFYQQIVRWSSAGHDVLVMDQQWAGQSEGAPGAIDRGFGVMRDVAAVAAYAARLAESLYGSSERLVLYGNSMGGLGVLGAYLMNRSNLVTLASGELRKDVAVVVQAAFLRPAPTLRNWILRTLARVPLLRDAPMPFVAGLPRLTGDPHVQQLVMQGVALENARCRATAFPAVEPDSAFLRELVRREAPPAGAVTMLHTERDTLACFDNVRAFVESAGAGRIQLVTLPGSDHVLEQSPTHLHYAVDAVNAALAAR